MATEFFLKLWDNHIIQLGVWQTVYMTFLTSLFAYVIGLPLGVVLWVTDKDGLHPNKGVNTVLGFIVNFFRSIPAVILMVAMIPGGKTAARHVDRQWRGHRHADHRRRAVRGPHGRILPQRGPGRRHRGRAGHGLHEPADHLACAAAGGKAVAHLRLDHLHGHDPQLYRPCRHARRHPASARSPSSTATREARSSSSGSACSSSSSSCRSSRSSARASSAGRISRAR